MEEMLDMDLVEEGTYLRGKFLDAFFGGEAMVEIADGQAIPSSLGEFDKQFIEPGDMVLIRAAVDDGRKEICGEIISVDGYLGRINREMLRLRAQRQD